MRSGRFVERFLEPGEQVVQSCTVSGSVDVTVDLPGRGRIMWAFITSDRLLFVDHAARPPKLAWWTWLDEISRVDVTVRWQQRVANRGRETIVTLQMVNGRHITCGHIHHMDGRRKTKRFTDTLTDAVHQASRRRDR